MANAMRAALALSTKSKFIHLCTNSGKGYPDVRVMFNLKRRSRVGGLPKAFTAMKDNFSTYLCTNVHSLKREQAFADPRCAVYYEDTKNFEGLTVYGKLEPVEDQAIRASLWKMGWEIYYRGGIDGGDFQVFRFVPERGRYYHGLSVEEFGAEA